jgi:hypothetical protein
MQPEKQPITLTFHLNTGKEDDDEAVDHMTRQLLSEIQELDVESAQLVKDSAAPEGTKSAEGVTLGALAVTVLPAIAPKVMELLQSWTMRAENRTVKIKAQVADRSIEVEYSPAAMSNDDLKRLVTTISEALPPATKT